MIEDFKLKFEPHLKDSQRWAAFLFMAEELLARPKPIHIIETGCARQTNNWVGDGQSTRLWDWISKKTGGKSWSVDISENSCAYGRQVAPNTKIKCEDSIKFLSCFGETEANRFDLLYLDSYDFNPPEALSELHHVGELAAIYEKLASGCLIAVDDCHAPDRGKHVLVDIFFKRMGIPSYFESYVTIWKKP